MNRLSRFLSLALCLIAPAQCRACVIVGEAGSMARITDESALIVWDEKTHTEQFVRLAHFQSTAKNFGFIVPTPSRPTLKEANGELFEQLDGELAPKLEHRTGKSYQFSFLLAGHTTKNTFGSASQAMNTDIAFFEEKRVGEYDAAVLKASDTKALNRWLKAHHYTTTPDFEEWAKTYVQRGWYVTAFKLAPAQTDAMAVLTAIKMTFKTQVPIYPYRETTRSQKVGGERTLRLFYIGTQRPQSHIRDENRRAAWGADTEYSASYNGTHLMRQNLTLPSGSLRLTAFTDLSSPRPGWGDLEFERASDQSKKTPPPYIVWDLKPVFIPLDLIGCVLLLFWALCRTVRLKRERDAQVQIPGT